MGISNLGNSPDDPALLEAGDINVARSSRELAPRYHFAGSEQKEGIFIQRWLFFREFQKV